MCGIAGILRLTPPGESARAAMERTPFDAIPEAWLNLLDDSIRHRGPDGQGRFRDRAVRSDGTVVDVALVHRRLSIIDHGGGAQPMVSQRGPGASLGLAPELSFHPLLFHGKPNTSVQYERLSDLPDTLAVVFNGCIYNHRELRSQLQAAGHRFVSDHSDTEVLLHGWREWGTGLADHLEGMYAAAVWDRRRSALLLTRDLAFEKPLFCFQREELFAFSSTAAGLVHLYARVFGAPQAASMDWLAEWARFGFSDDPSSVDFEWPARAMVHASDEWGGDMRFSLLPQRDGSRRVSVESAERMLRASVRERLESDVPLGCFLSGGVDSSLIACFAKQELGRLRTFSVKMPDPAYDESAYAEQVAKHLGTEHTTLECQANPAEDLVNLIQQFGRPFGDSSLLPTYWVSRATRQEGGIKVALTGDGGDELFCGYERYKAARWLPLAAKLGEAVDVESIPDVSPKSRLSKLRRLLVASRHGYQELLAIFPRPDLHRLIDPAELGPWHSVDAGELDPPGIDFWWYLGHDLMRKVDGAAMSVALETRAPFLSRGLITDCLSAPLDDLMPRGQRKGLLRAVARRHLPAHVVDRPKMGFAIPIGEWFRSDYGGMRTLLLDHLNSAEPFGSPSLGIGSGINMTYARQMLDEHLGTGPSGLVKRDHSQRLYMLLVLSIWSKWLGTASRANP
ncbi:MAG: asparagine synthase (glutamine-hydrolyzing) [Phycisphaerales bacterium]